MQEQRGVTLSVLARAKGLSDQDLIAHGVHDRQYNSLPAVAIPYIGQDGSRLSTRYRVALDGADRFRSTKGHKVQPYGLNRLDEARAAGWVLIVEGETDCWVAWKYGVPALGIPGKSTWQSKWATFLHDIPEVILWQEPDADDLTADMGASLPDLKVCAAEGAMGVRDTGAARYKDLCEANCANENMPALFLRIRQAALPVEDVRLAEKEAELDTLREHASEVLRAADPLLLLRAELSRSYGGDIGPLMIVYICATTRLLELRHGGMLAHLLLIAPPAAGKSYTLNSAMRFLPAEAFLRIDAGSPRVLVYGDDDLRHRLLVYNEADSIPKGDEDGSAASAIRNLLSEGQMSYDVVEKGTDGVFHVRHISRPGPTVMITTAVRLLGEQLLSRLFVLALPDSREQIAAQLKAQGQMEVDEPRPPTPALVMYQLLLQRLAPWRVNVLFAPALAELMGRSLNAPRIQRDYARLLAMIKAVAIIRHTQRRRDTNGRLVAELADYEAVYHLIEPMYAASAQGVTENTRKVVAAVAELCDTPESHASYTDIARLLQLHHEQVRRTCRAAIKQGWLENAEDKPGKTAKIRPGEPIPPEAGLPRPDQLHNCTRDGGLSTSN